MGRKTDEEGTMTEAAAGGSELSYRELEAVAGGGDTWVGIICGTCYPGSGNC